MSALDQIEPIEQASVDELRALQLARLKEAVHYAHERVPHYRQKFDAAGVYPASSAAGTNPVGPDTAAT